MPATLTYRDKIYEVPDGLTVKEALIKIGLEPQLYLAVRNRELVTEDQKLKPDDKIKLVAIVSGGARSACAERPISILQSPITYYANHKV